MKVKVMGKAVYRPLLAMALLSGLAACSSAPKKGAVPPYDATMTTAETQVTTVGSEAAIKSFEDAARADPTSTHVPSLPPKRCCSAIRMTWWPMASSPWPASASPTPR